MSETNEALVARTMLNPHVKEILVKAEPLLKGGCEILFKWTCGGCGERITSDQVNEVHCSYIHDEDGCGYTTETVQGDLGFAVLKLV